MAFVISAASLHTQTYSAQLFPQRRRLPAFPVVSLAVFIPFLTCSTSTGTPRIPDQWSFCIRETLLRLCLSPQPAC